MIIEKFVCRFRYNRLVCGMGYGFEWATATVYGILKGLTMRFL
jgi:hypothetical protein